jgi:uncharacterized Zn-binding protein involved in type VI secretion
MFRRVATMPSASRNGDNIITGHGCSAISSIVASSQTKVWINGILAAVTPDPIAPHTIRSGDSCVPHSAVVNEGSAKVFYAGLPAARIGDSADNGTVIQGSPNVFVGG